MGKPRHAGATLPPPSARTVFELPFDSRGCCAPPSSEHSVSKRAAAAMASAIALRISRASA
eukprot:222850-Chlamydomonas_euryale.AAC.3